jgi:hypothetical protein
MKDNLYLSYGNLEIGTVSLKQYQSCTINTLKIIQVTFYTILFHFVL